MILEMPLDAVIIDLGCAGRCEADGPELALFATPFPPFQHTAKCATKQQFPDVLHGAAQAPRLPVRLGVIR